MKIKIAILALVLYTTSLFPGEQEEKAARRIYTHLLLNDGVSAVREAKKSVELFPDSKSMRLALLRALCENGDEIEALREWKTLTSLFKDLGSDRSCLETLAWGVLKKGSASSQLVIRLHSLVGAAMTKDAKAIPLMQDELRGSNALLRSIAVRLSSEYGDIPLQDELARLLKEEKIWYVRLEVIRAVGTLRMKELRPALKEIVGNPRTLAEEKAAAIISLVSMYEDIEESELKGLIRSPRAGLRHLACEIIAHLDLKEKAIEIRPLLKDTSPEVRIAALNMFGVLGLTSIQDQPLFELIKEDLNDPIPEVAITANWLALLLGKKEGGEGLAKWMGHADAPLRRLASAALAATGLKGIKVAVEMIEKSEDPYVRANLALGLIGQRTKVSLACETLYQLFIQEKDTLWMWDESVSPLFSSLAPSRVRHIEQIPNYPMVVNQLVRLDLLSVLSILRYPKAQEAVKGFLQNSNWGITGTAAATLLQEGDDESLDVVRNLLSDPEEKIRVQAALILAMIGGDPAASKVLQEAYPHVDRERKIQIVGALGHIGDPSSVPFLLNILEEPFQVIRVVAACAVIQCLYH